MRTVEELENEGNRTHRRIQRPMISLTLWVWSSKLFWACSPVFHRSKNDQTVYNSQVLLVQSSCRWSSTLQAMWRFVEHVSDHVESFIRINAFSAMFKSVPLHIIIRLDLIFRGWRRSMGKTLQSSKTSSTWWKRKGLILRALQRYLCFGWKGTEDSCVMQRLRARRWNFIQRVMGKCWCESIDRESLSD
jgi:hypothetical protein